MYRNFWVLITILILVSACAPSGTATPIPIINGATTTPSLLPTATRTFLPTATPTASITPLPTIPTFTPTFDVRTIVTVTSAPKMECPQKDVEPKFNFEIYPSGQKYISHPNINEFLEFLNSSGKVDKLNFELRQTISRFEISDITNDGNPDLIIVSGSLFQIINIIQCKNGRYYLFPKDSAEAETLASEQVRFSIQDLNRNGIPDILSIGDGRGLNINILEWDGEKFRDLTTDETMVNASMPNTSVDGFELIDLNNDGISEFILKGPPNSWYYPGEPLRTRIDTYQWNGKTYSPLTAFSSPQYRFQAIQDGDALTIQGSYKEAIMLYQTAINSDILDWWSKERFESSRGAAINSTTPPTLAPDVSEYPKLAAYAYYRIMLLHLVQEQGSDATTVYNTLQEKFSNDPYGHPYVEMATAFWDAYQSTHKMYDGCAAAIQYTVEHPEILTPLGSDYHGSQSHTYVPEDVCPFR